MTIYYKATRLDGTSRNTVRWEVGEVTTHPTSTEMVRNDASTYLSLSAEPGETLIGGSYPCRLFEVMPIGDLIGADAYPHKRCALSARVIRELPGHLALGPNGVQVDALLTRLRTVTTHEIQRVSVEWDAAWGAAREAARDAAGTAARGAAGTAAGYLARDVARRVARGAAGYAALALVVRDLISEEHFHTLTDPLFSVIGDPQEWV